MTPKEVYDKIIAGDYNTKLEYVNYKKDKEKWLAYTADESKLLEQFKQDAMKSVGLSKRKNADKIWSYAWQEGHGSGLYDVLGVLQDLADLFT